MKRFLKADLPDAIAEQLTMILRDAGSPCVKTGPNVHTIPVMTEFLSRVEIEEEFRERALQAIEEARLTGIAFAEAAS